MKKQEKSLKQPKYKTQKCIKIQSINKDKLSLFVATCKEVAKDMGMNIEVIDE